MILALLLAVFMLAGWASSPEHQLFRGIVHFGSQVSYDAATVSDSGPTDDVDVSGASVVKLDTGSNAVTVGGFANGRTGQVLHVVNPDSTNNATLENSEGGGSQDILLSSGGDEQITGPGGWTLYCNGTDWIEVD
jgi:hypothetical protein